eukprot:m.37677 g.37677  ORF g.37677 m.37677 type:complete len:281 (+) comp10147_c0_seq9:2060-2902(+)
MCVCVLWSFLVCLLYLQFQQPLEEDIEKDHEFVKSLYESHMAPSGRWRISQQQPIISWNQWYQLRMYQRLPSVCDQRTEAHVKTTELYSWVLTAASVIRERLFSPSVAPNGNLILHIVGRVGREVFTALELCSLLPEVTKLEIIQFIESGDEMSPQYGRVVCDGVLPGNSDIPAQHLRCVNIFGSYANILSSYDDVPAPDLVFFCDTIEDEDEGVLIDYSDALAFLQKRHFPITWTMRYKQRFDTVKQWLKDMGQHIAKGIVETRIWMFVHLCAHVCEKV